MTQDDLILNVTAMGVGMHLGAWRYREGSPFDYTKLAFYGEIARISEAGKLHALFLADTLAVDEENFERPNLGAMDPTIVLAGIAGATRHLGLVATASTTYNDPFSLARRFSTLDHLSNGRAAWNIVTTFVPAVAANFGATALPAGPERYSRAEEFVEIVRRLWLGWQDGALVGDKQTGQFADRARVVPLDHKGANFQVRGPLTLPRSPQTSPVLFQAGSSEEGRALGASVADVVFTARNTIAQARAFYADMKQRARRNRRDPDGLKVLPGIVPVIGGTESDARARKARLDEFAGDAELRKLALRVGIPAAELHLDKPLPFDKIAENAGFRGSQGFRDAALALGGEEKLTVRDIIYRNGGGHLQVVGTPEQVSALIEEWYREGAADGFNLMIDVLPDGLSAFVDEVVPLLRRRGVFRSDYRGETLRANLGLQDRTIPFQAAS